MSKRKVDRWHELCQLVATDDGRPVREVGIWTEKKLWFWNRYVDIVTSAMVGHPMWRTGLAYVDLFAGPGVCVIRENGRRIPGSVLIAAHAPKPFRRIVACELNPDLANACEARIANTSAAGRCRIVTGDCNARIHDILSAIPESVLTLAFIDPPGLDAHFETIRTLAAKGRVDLLVLFADAVDALRNVGQYTTQQDSNLDLVLGVDSNWRTRRKELNDCTANRFRILLADIYRGQLRQLGYSQFGEKIMSTRHGPLYRLVFASKHERGLEFWDKVTKKDKGGQKDLF
ncbi:MAG: three-Cys-motif partner protein TcmP [Planctomycetia bacterium]|nr:three-Cys-motif partner protein TcmP [Planctomycetia bacterium]